MRAPGQVAFILGQNSRSCPEIRRFFSQQDSQVQLATLQNALTHQDDLLQAAKQSAWRRSSGTAVRQRRRNHCLECLGDTRRPSAQSSCALLKVLQHRLLSAILLSAPLPILWQFLPEQMWSSQIVRRHLQRALPPQKIGVQACLRSWRCKGRKDQRFGWNFQQRPIKSLTPALNPAIQRSPSRLRTARTANRRSRQRTREPAEPTRRKTSRGPHVRGRSMVKKRSRQYGTSLPAKETIRAKADLEFFKLGRLEELEGRGQDVQAQPQPAQATGGYAGHLGSQTGAPIDKTPATLSSSGPT